MVHYCYGQDAVDLYIPMSTELPSKSNVLHSHYKVVVVAASYNERFTTPLLTHCLDELGELAPQSEVEVVRVPGAFEVPVMVKRAIVEGLEKPDAVIALGVILRGSTAHADLIGSAITQQLLSIACETLVPVIHEVLLLDDEKQAFARCVASSLNRGREAARTCVRMMELEEDLHLQNQRGERMAGINPNGSLLS